MVLFKLSQGIFSLYKFYRVHIHNGPPDWYLHLYNVTILISPCQARVVKNLMQ